MSTTRAVLTSAEGSFLAGMFSGNFDAGHKRDKEPRGLGARGSTLLRAPNLSDRRSDTDIVDAL